MNETPSKEAKEQIDYNLPDISKPKWWLYTIAVFFAAFAMYFPVASKMESNVRSALGSLPGCPIAYDSMSFDFFLPKLVVKNLNAPASCFDQAGPPLTVDEARLYVRGISFSPFGPNFRLETQLFGNPLEALISVGLGGASVNMKDASVELSKISPMLPAGLNLAGKANIDLLANVAQEGVKNLDLRLTSKNLVLPAQSIQAFAFSRMNLNNLLLKAEMGSDGKLNVEEFILGDDASPIRANFSGDITLVKQNPQLSRLNLAGEVSFSEDFLSQYSIVEMLMNQFDKKDGFYQVQLRGTIGNPAPSSPGK